MDEQSNHIASAFDRDLKKVQAQIMKRGGLVEDVIARAEELDQMYNALFREFITFMLEDPRNITACLHLHFIAKNVERMGGYCTLMVEQGTYLVTGAHPDEARIKAEENYMRVEG